MATQLVFPVNSTSTITTRCRRFFFGVMQRSAVAHLISHVGVFVCRQTAGTSKWSPHAFGDAGDVFVKLAGTEGEIRDNLDRIARNVIAQATKRTRANRGIPRPVVHVVWLDKEWIRGRGIGHYDGVFHATHVHVGFSFSTTKVPPCAS